jgi:hypothetical protein
MIYHGTGHEPALHPGRPAFSRIYAYLHAICMCTSCHVFQSEQAERYQAARWSLIMYLRVLHRHLLHRPQPPASEKPDEESRELPDEVIMAMLRREVLLTRAKLHALCYEQIMGERKLRSLKTQLRQVLPATLQPH